MSTQDYTYKGYQVQVVGLSHYIFAPGEVLPGYYSRGEGAIGHAITKVDAKIFINKRIVEFASSNPFNDPA